jgi:hypothetical protein
MTRRDFDAKNNKKVRDIDYNLFFLFYLGPATGQRDGSTL